MPGRRDPRRRRRRPGGRLLILLVGGCACVGKTTASAAIAARLGLPRVSIYDGFDGDVSPFRGPDPWNLDAGELAARLIAKGPAMRANLCRLVDLHPRGAVIEGEGIDPSLAAQLARDRGTRAAFLIERDGAAIAANMSARSSTFRALPARRRALVIDMCDRYNRWLRDQAAAHGQPAVAPRPWSTLADRILEV